MKLLFMMVLLYGGGIVFSVSAQDLTDNGIRKWVSGFSSLNLLQSNADASYATVTKSYLGNTDTLLVFAHSRTNPVDILIGYNLSRSFISKDHLFAHGVNKAMVSNVKTGRKITYQSIRSGGVIKDKKQYYLLDNTGRLAVYELNGRILHSDEGVEKVVGNQDKLLITRKRGDGKYSVISWNGMFAAELYCTFNKIEKTELMPSGVFMSIRENNLNSGTRSVKIIDCITGKQIAKLKNLPEKTVKVTEIGIGVSFLISAETHIPVTDHEMTKLWYGSDKLLRFTKNGSTKYRYFLIRTGEEVVEELPTNQFEIYTPLNNSRYLWAFSDREEFNYTHMNPLYNMFLYDTKKHTSSLIFPAASEIFGSKDGRYAVSFGGQEKVWKLFDLQKQEMNIIEGSDLSVPVFSSNNQTLFFSGKTDLYIYNIQSRSLKKMGFSETEVSIINKDIQMGFTNLTTKFNTVTVDIEQPIRLKLHNPKINTVSIVELNENNRVVVVPETDRKIKKVVFADSGKRTFTIEENYNLPDGLYSGRYSGKKKLLYQTNSKDKKISELKAELINFKNSLGIPLKGVLTYPVDYNPMKKYPMIVRIYQKQSGGFSNYISGMDSPDGFNKRMLIEQGYFVYQPDIVFDYRGTGIAALDCVNASMDALSGRSGIDFFKVGLTGHSMGGYETNFIATQSKRFAAYISGASVANIVQKYFSYNKLFEVADYARFENGQFEMNVPYADNSELYFKNNPINFVQNVSAPMFLWAGSKDCNVVPQQTEAFYIGLARNKKPVIALFYKNQEHSLGQLTAENYDLNRRTIEWWNYFLKNRKGVQWIEAEMKIE